MKKLAIFWIVAVCCIFSTVTQAQDFGFKGIGGKLGFVDPEVLSATIGFGAHADLGTVAKSIKIVPSLEYWSKNNFSQFSIHADGRYYFPTSGTISPFAGGGLGLFITSIDFDSEFITGTSSTDLGLDLLGGVDIPAGPQLTFTAELKYSLTELHSLRITGGIMYNLK